MVPDAVLPDEALGVVYYFEAPDAGYCSEVPDEVYCSVVLFEELYYEELCLQVRFLVYYLQALVEGYSMDPEVCYYYFQALFEAWCFLAHSVCWYYSMAQV